MDRYHRQMLLPQIGAAGQGALGRSRVLLVGCGALGSHVAEQLVRGGIGFLRIADRDIVEWSNLQRQVLFDENDAKRAWPKAAAAVERLERINSQIELDAQVVDVNAGNIESLCEGIDVIVDGTDNVATRYLINDVAVKTGLPWIYGACVGVEGRVMALRPGGVCLRCVFPEPPNPADLETCDTAGVLAPAASMVASMQVTMAMQILIGRKPVAKLFGFDVWRGTFGEISLEDGRREDCVCCGQKRFEYLDRPVNSAAATLCGREAVQVRGRQTIELKGLAQDWRRVGAVEENRFFVRCRLTEPAGTILTAFEDGRLIVQGTRDLGRAQALYARFIGA